MDPNEPLIHIGYHKTGTTYLQRQVFSDSSLGFTRVGAKASVDDAFVVPGPFRFSTEHARAVMDPLIVDAVNAGTVPVISHERLSGHELLGRFDADVIARRLHAAYPKARVLIVIREQRGMMRSAYKQRIKHWGTETPQQLWPERKLRELRFPVPRLEAYEYHDLITRYQELFGKDRVLVLPYERLRTERVAFIAEICTFAGITPPSDAPDAEENVSLPSGLIAPLRGSNKVLRLFGLLPTFGSPFAENFLEMPRRRFLLRLQRIVPSRFGKRAERRLAATIAEIAGDRFASSNLETAKATGLDLASLGYTIGAP